MVLRDFISNLGPSDLSGGEGAGAALSTARELWRRGQRSKVLDNALTKARNLADTDLDFSRQMAIAARQLVRSKDFRTLYTAAERDAIKRIANGTAKNLYRQLSRAGFSDSTPFTLMMSAGGAGAGAAIGGTLLGPVGGTLGSVVVPMLGRFGKRMAERLTARDARFADEVLRAGSRGQDIVDSYLRFVPAPERNPRDLATLLMRPDVRLNTIAATPLTTEAIELAGRGRSVMADVAATVAGAGAASSLGNQDTLSP